MKNVRPYLTIDFSIRPREGVNTSVKGWMDDPKNIATFERAAVVDRVTPAIQTKSVVIIDLVEGKVIKNAVGKPDDELVGHYIVRYETMIKQSLTEWARREVVRGASSEDSKQV